MLEARVTNSILALLLRNVDTGKTHLVHGLWNPAHWHRELWSLLGEAALVLCPFTLDCTRTGLVVLSHTAAPTPLVPEFNV